MDTIINKRQWSKKMEASLETHLLKTAYKYNSILFIFPLEFFRFFFLSVFFSFLFHKLSLEVFDFFTPHSQHLRHSTMLSKLRTPSISTIATRQASTCAVCTAKRNIHHTILL